MAIFKLFVNTQKPRAFTHVPPPEFDKSEIRNRRSKWLKHLVFLQLIISVSTLVTGIVSTAVEAYADSHGNMFNFSSGLSLIPCNIVVPLLAILITVFGLLAFRTKSDEILVVVYMALEIMMAVFLGMLMVSAVGRATEAIKSIGSWAEKWNLIPYVLGGCEMHIAWVTLANIIAHALTIFLIIKSLNQPDISIDSQNAVSPIQPHLPATPARPTPLTTKLIIFQLLVSCFLLKFGIISTSYRIFYASENIIACIIQIGANIAIPLITILNGVWVWTGFRLRSPSRNIILSSYIVAHSVNIAGLAVLIFFAFKTAEAALARSGDYKLDMAVVCDIQIVFLGLANAIANVKSLDLILKEPCAYAQQFSVHPVQKVNDDDPPKSSDPWARSLRNMAVFQMIVTCLMFITGVVSILAMNILVDRADLLLTGARIAFPIMGMINAKLGLILLRNHIYSGRVDVLMAHIYLSVANVFSFGILLLAGLLRGVAVAAMPSIHLISAAYIVGFSAAIVIANLRSALLIRDGYKSGKVKLDGIPAVSNPPAKVCTVSSEDTVPYMMTEDDISPDGNSGPENSQRAATPDDPPDDERNANDEP